MGRVLNAPVRPLGTCATRPRRQSQPQEIRPFRPLSRERDCTLHTNKSRTHPPHRSRKPIPARRRSTSELRSSNGRSRLSTAIPSAESHQKDPPATRFLRANETVGCSPTSWGTAHPTSATLAHGRPGWLPPRGVQAATTGFHSASQRRFPPHKTARDIKTAQRFMRLTTSHHVRRSNCLHNTSGPLTRPRNSPASKLRRYPRKANTLSPPADWQSERHIKHGSSDSVETRYSCVDRGACAVTRDTDQVGESGQGHIACDSSWALCLVLSLQYFPHDAGQQASPHTFACSSPDNTRDTA